MDHSASDMNLTEDIFTKLVKIIEIRKYNVNEISLQFTPKTTI